MKNVDPACLQVAVSFGGTKIAIALVDTDNLSVLARSERIEWRLHPHWSAMQPLESLLALVVNEVAALLQKHNFSISGISRVGIAWPGPGRYERGLLQATFIPGVGENTNVHEALLDALREHFGHRVDHISIVSGLDANARALGELHLSNGAFSNQGSASSTNGIVLNIATGVAGAIIASGQALRSWPSLGSTYGQWGRFAFRNQISGEWIWRPTVDGSIPGHCSEEARLTEVCGGPALWARYSLQNGQARCLGERDIVRERLCLLNITREAYAERGQAMEFVRAVGSELAGAIECVLNGFQLPSRDTKVVLTGGVGEYFGAPPAHVSGKDEFLAAIRASGMQCTVVRSRAGLDAEFTGAVLMS